MMSRITLRWSTLPCCRSNATGFVSCPCGRWQSFGLCHQWFIMRDTAVVVRWGVIARCKQLHTTHAPRQDRGRHRCCVEKLPSRYSVTSILPAYSEDQAPKNSFEASHPSVFAWPILRCWFPADSCILRKRVIESIHEPIFACFLSKNLLPYLDICRDTDP